MEVKLVFQDAQDGFDPLSGVEHREIGLMQGLEGYLALDEGIHIGQIAGDPQFLCSDVY